MIILDYRDRRPLYEQVTDRLRELMATGVLPQDSQLPSVRSLAMELSINPNTIQRAYAELERQGYIYSVKGKGSFVAENAHIQDKKRELLRSEWSEAVQKARRLGIDRRQAHDMIDEIYDEMDEICDEGGDQHDRGQKSDETV